MTVDTLSELIPRADGVQLGRLEPLTTLFVRTRNSLYQLVVAAGGDVLLQGGRFPEPTPAFVEGAGAGGSLLKTGWIVVGLLMEFRVGRKLFSTSPVIAIAVEPPDDALAN